ncbi:amidase family protein [Alkalicoccus daliensis]|uniref:Amidase n=1 Tax=Alkalicoccus daliensis TaxID=745820 RepID=A0A1H0KI35_9BACI|nr:amidase family protein [Alkalicoccus daliensis]SDO55466.1 amidase [Alkalicoccus daliensis]
MLQENDYIKMDAAALAAGIKQKEFSPEEVMKAFEARKTKVNPALNAVVRSRNREIVLKEYQKQSIFSGVPFLTKDISQAIKGELLTAGSSLLHHHSIEDSHLVSRFRQSGFMIAGQTNTPEFGLKNITEPKRYGPTRNPHHLEFSAGGSSGGAAAAVAAGMVPIAGASDGGGSIRIPASFTGIFGLKPTRGRTPVGPGTGRQWQGAAIDFCVSRSVRDSALLLKEVQVFQREAAFPYPVIPHDTFLKISRPLPKLRIAFSSISPVGTKVSKAAENALFQTVAFLKEEGHELEEAAPAIDGRELMRKYYVMNSGEMAAVGSRLHQALGRKIRQEEFELESWMLQEAGKYISGAEYAQSLQSWDEAAFIMSEFHQQYDIYLTPATADSAPRVGELTYSAQEDRVWRERMKQTENRQELIYEMFLPSLAYTPFTQLANLTGQPAVSLPVGESELGMPVGVQAMAWKGEEILLLQLADKLERSPLWKQKSLPEIF